MKKKVSKSKQSEPEKPRRKPGRPRKVIDENLLKKLTKLHLSDRTIASILEVHVDTLHSRYSEQMEQWKSLSKGKIAEILFDEAITRRAPWALKTIVQRHLGYFDRAKIEATNFNQNYENLSDEQLREKMKQLSQKLSIDPEAKIILDEGLDD